MSAAVQALLHENANLRWKNGPIEAMERDKSCQGERNRRNYSAQGRPRVLCELKAQLLEPVVQVVGAAVMFLGRLLHKAEHAHSAAVH